MLTRIRKPKKSDRIKESDHNVLISKFNCKLKDIEHTKNETYNLSNEECQSKFEIYTTGTKTLSGTIDPDGDIDQITERLIKKINGCIAINFRKTRIQSSNKRKTEKYLYNKMKALKNEDNEESKEELSNVIKAFTDKADKNFETLQSELMKVKNIEGKINNKELLKLKKIL